MIKVILSKAEHEALKPSSPVRKFLESAWKDSVDGKREHTVGFENARSVMNRLARFLSDAYASGAVETDFAIVAPGQDRLRGAPGVYKAVFHSTPETRIGEELADLWNSGATLYECVKCGATFTAGREARYCSDVCRTTTHRKQKAG